MILALLSLAVIWDNDPHREPIVAVACIVLGLIAFLFVWPTHHTLGAIIAVTATVGALLALLGRLTLYRGEWPILPIFIAFVLVLIASDDVFQHAFGWETPLDWAWKNHLRELLPSH